MNYYDEIKIKLLKCEIYDRAKDYAKDKNKVKVYFETGKLLNEAGKEYGKNIIKTYSNKLVVEIGKKYNERTLYRMRKFYEIFSSEKLTPLVSKLSWSHYLQLLSLRSNDEIIYYINLTLKHNLSKRQLQDKIKNHEYDRLTDETKNKIIESKELQVNDLVPNPIVLKSNILKEELSEKKYIQLTEDEKRFYQRDLTRKGNYSLNIAAKKAGAKNFDKFHNSGYKRLYNGETANDIAKRKKLRYREDVLDNMGMSL